MKQFLSQKLPLIWQQKYHPVSLLLWPLSLIYFFVISLRRFAYRNDWLKSTSVDCPVIIVGNITVGGTGKTPLVIWLSEYLTQKGFKVGIISRGYGANAQQWPIDVKRKHTFEQVGDEVALICKRLNLPLVISPLRVQSAQYLTRTYQVNCIISDDGLQHYALKRDMEILVIDGKNRFGNQRLLPAGPLREPLSWISQQALKVYAGPAAQSEPVNIQTIASCFKSVSNPDLIIDIDEFEPGCVNAVAGIGFPDKFFSTLKALGFSLNTRYLPDHHVFSTKDISFNNDHPVIMTEKDAVKCTHIANKNCWYLEINVKPSEEFINQLDQRLVKILPKPNK